MLNQPAGHLEPDESLVEAALRETLRGNRLGRAPDRVRRRLPVEGADADGSDGRHYLRFAFAAEPVAHDPARALDEGIVRALWMTPGGAAGSAGAPPQPAGLAVVADYLAGRRHPADAAAAAGMSESARTIVGMSGGVDSSVAALLLRDAGEPIAGLFMQNWADDGSGDCRAEDDRRDAVAVCGRLGIPIHFRDFSRRVLGRRVRAFPRRVRRRPHAEPGRAVQPRDQVQALSSTPRASWAPSASPPATTPASSATATAGGCCARADRGKDQSYFLHQLGQDAAGGDPVPARRRC